jgi:hypothetical protein
VAHAPKSPIILVGTHADRKKGTKNDIQEGLDSLLKKFRRFKQVKGKLG